MGSICHFPGHRDAISSLDDPQGLPTKHGARIASNRKVGVTASTGENMETWIVDPDLCPVMQCDGRMVWDSTVDLEFGGKMARCTKCGHLTLHWIGELDENL